MVESAWLKTGWRRGIGLRGNQVAGRTCHAQQERHDSRDQHRAERARSIVGRRTEQSANSRHQRSAGSGHRETRANRSPALELDQRFGIADGVAAHRQRNDVAAVLALGADPRREPPDGGVVEEDGLGKRLQQIHQEVVAADVRELVGEDGFDLRRRQPRERRDGQQDYRLHPADDGRRIDGRRIHDMNATRKTERRGDSSGGVRPCRRRGRA
jgi:hypothetical protein